MLLRKQHRFYWGRFLTPDHHWQAAHTESALQLGPWIFVRPQISNPCLRNWFNRYSRWFMTAITLLIWVLVVRVEVKNIPSSLTCSTCSICIIEGGGTYWRRDGCLNTISLVLEILIKSLLQSARLCMWMYSSTQVVSVCWEHSCTLN